MQKLDLQQRQEAERLIEAAQAEDVLRELVYELIALREEVQALEDEIDFMGETQTHD